MLNQGTDGGKSSVSRPDRFNLEATCLSKHRKEFCVGFIGGMDSCQNRAISATARNQTPTSGLPIRSLVAILTELRCIQSAALEAKESKTIPVTGRGAHTLSDVENLTFF
jgi:hypothetical protein